MIERNMYSPIHAVLPTTRDAPQSGLAKVVVAAQKFRVCRPEQRGEQAQCQLEDVQSKG